MQKYADQLRERTEQDARMEQQYGVDVRGWPEEVTGLEYDWPDTESALIRLVAVLFAWNDTRDWTDDEYISLF